MAVKYHGLSLFPDSREKIFLDDFCLHLHTMHLLQCKTDSYKIIFVNDNF